MKKIFLAVIAMIACLPVSAITIDECYSQISLLTGGESVSIPAEMMNAAMEADSSSDNSEVTEFKKMIKSLDVTEFKGATQETVDAINSLTDEITKTDNLSYFKESGENSKDTKLWILTETETVTLFVVEKALTTISVARIVMDGKIAEHPEFIEQMKNM